MTLTFQPSLTESECAPTVRRIAPSVASAYVVKYHYLHRAPNIGDAFGLIRSGELLGVCTFGVPASRHLQMSACPTNPDAVTELNRLWCDDALPTNTESWFVSRCLKDLAPFIVVSYADLSRGHVGYVYRALSWRYAGWTDMERHTPRLDYIPNDPTKHTREATRSGIAERIRRTPKVRYWTTTGDRGERRRLSKKCGWPSLDWRVTPPPHAQQVKVQ